MKTRSFTLFETIQFGLPTEEKKKEVFQEDTYRILRDFDLKKEMKESLMLEIEIFLYYLKRTVVSAHRACISIRRHT